MQARWTPEDAQLLRQLRELSGADRATFARRHAMSVTQLTELEEGGMTRFYTEVIKANAGYKLLRRLGHEPVGLPERACEMQETVPALEIPVAAPAPATFRAGRSNHSKSRWRGALMGGVAVAALAATVVGVLLAAQSDAYARVLQVVQAVVKSNAALAPVVGASAHQPSAVAPLPSASASAEPAIAAASMASAPEPSQAAAAAPACGPVSREGAWQYQSPVAARPGNYVHVQAAREISFCVIDSQDRQTMTTLKPGESVTVSGAPPFVIATATATAQWNDLRVFFQGLRVNIDPGLRPQTIVLNAL